MSLARGTDRADLLLLLVQRPCNCRGPDQYQTVLEMLLPQHASGHLCRGLHRHRKNGHFERGVPCHSAGEPSTLWSPPGGRLQCRRPGFLDVCADRQLPELLSCLFMIAQGQTDCSEFMGLWRPVMGDSRRLRQMHSVRCTVHMKELCREAPPLSLSNVCVPASLPRFCRRKS